MQWRLSLLWKVNEINAFVSLSPDFDVTAHNLRYCRFCMLCALSWHHFPVAIERFYYGNRWLAKKQSKDSSMQVVCQLCNCHFSTCNWYGVFRIQCPRDPPHTERVVLVIRARYTCSHLCCIGAHWFSCCQMLQGRRGDISSGGNDGRLQICLCRSVRVFKMIDCFGGCSLAQMILLMRGHFLDLSAGDEEVEERERREEEGSVCYV